MKTKLALILVSVILGVSLAANAYSYVQQQQGLAANNDLRKQAVNLESQIVNLNNQMNSRQSKRADLETQIASLENQTTDMGNQANSLQSENAALQSENSAMQNQISQIGTPKIVTRLGATDVRSTPAAGHPWSGVIRFYISGEVWNVGSGTAKNGRLHVSLFQGEVVANETHVELGTINAGSYADVAANIYYTGDAITYYTIIPEFD